MGVKIFFGMKTTMMMKKKKELTTTRLVEGAREWGSDGSDMDLAGF